MVAMILALLGDRQRALDELELTYQEIDAHQAAGAARAAADTGRMLLVGGTVGDGNAGFDAVAARAAFHSQGTAYRSYFNYVTMLTSYLTGDVERAVCAFAEIQQLGRWAHHDLHFDRMSRHSYAVVLSGRGQFGAARAELSRLTESRGDTVAGAELIIHLMLTHRLNLAMGQLEEVLDDTSPTGPLSSQHVQRANPRFVPGVLLIRGSALARQGMEQSAADHFLRATRQAVIADEFLSLAAVETAEYRHWLAGLNRRALPPGIPLDVYEALLRRPILIAQSLPTLTRQRPPHSAAARDRTQHRVHRRRDGHLPQHPQDPPAHALPPPRRRLPQAGPDPRRGVRPAPLNLPTPVIRPHPVIPGLTRDLGSGATTLWRSRVGARDDVVAWDWEDGGHGELPRGIR